MNQARSAEEYNQYWRTIIDTMQDGLMVVDEGGVIVSVNPALEKLTGYAAADLVGRPCTVLDCDACAGQRPTGDEARCGLFRDGTIRRCKCTLRKKDGAPLHVLKNAAVIKDGQGAYLGGVETITDLSEVVARERELADLRRAMGLESEFEGMIGQSPAMQRLYSLLHSAAQSDAPILLVGESGTGKEMAADALHRLGRRADRPFIKVNCAALSQSLLESELFGHVKGAFTGADHNRQGRFEAANGGDLLLDEVGDLPAATQVKLLRVLQEKVIERVGDHKPIAVDVRVIAATNRDLRQMVEEGGFRQDLYYRIAVIPINLPPLRQRPADIPLLVEAFIKRIGKRSGKAITGLDREAMDLLLRHPWPGNVRELMGALEYAFVLCPGGVIGPQHLPETIGGGQDATPPVAAPPAASHDERKRLLAALRQSGGRKAQAARLLGVSRVTLWKKLKAHGIDLETPLD